MNQAQFNQYKPTEYEINHLPQIPYEEVVYLSCHRKLPHQLFLDRYSENQKRALFMLPMGRNLFGKPNSCSYPIPEQHVPSKDGMDTDHWPAYAESVSFRHWERLATSPYENRNELGHQIVAFFEIGNELDQVKTGEHPYYDSEDGDSVDEAVEAFMSDSFSRFWNVCEIMDAAVADTLIEKSFQNPSVFDIESDEICKKIMDYLMSKRLQQLLHTAAEQAFVEWADECNIEISPDIDLQTHPQRYKFNAMLDERRALVVGFDFYDHVLDNLVPLCK